MAEAILFFVAIFVTSYALNPLNRELLISVICRKIEERYGEEPSSLFVEGLRYAFSKKGFLYFSMLEPIDEYTLIKVIVGEYPLHRTMLERYGEEWIYM